MRTIFISLLVTVSALISSVPQTAKELNIFQEKIALQNAENMFIDALNSYYANETDKAINIYSRLVDEFENSTNQEIGVITAHAMFNLALAYNKSGNAKAEWDLYSRIISKFINSNDADIETITANSLFNQAIIAYHLNDTKSERAIYERLADRFSNTRNENINVFLANAMASLGYIYAQANEKTKAVSILNKLISKFENSKDEYMQNLLVRAFVNLGVNYVDLGMLKEGLASYQRLIERFKTSENMDILQAVGAAVTNKIELEICNGLKPSFSDENEAIANKSRYSQLMYEFLQILYSNERQSDKLSAWADKYSDFSFKNSNGNFNFSDLDRWLEKLKNSKKKWAKECIDALKKFADK